MASGISRGFHRIGIILAVPPVLLAIWLAAQETSYSWNSHPWDKDPIIEPVHSGRMWGSFTNEIALLIVAALLYAVSLAIGWVFGRSASSNRRQ